VGEDRSLEQLFWRNGNLNSRLLNWKSTPTQPQWIHWPTLHERISGGEGEDWPTVFICRG